MDFEGFVIPVILASEKDFKKPFRAASTGPIQDS